tara:strand:- start:1271 stop:1507 length:237 start_codon:yes stop_codon:yes gene_type:complete
MYILLIFHDIEATKLNSMVKFSTIKDIIKWSKGIIKYSDVGKKVRVYKTAKSFFRILFVSKSDEEKYFKYKFRDLRLI